MKAALYSAYGSPDVLQVKEVAAPTPRDDEVLVRISAAVVSRGDCTARSGHPISIRLATGLMRPKKPILGSNLAGTIEAIGSDVRRCQLGDQIVAATGAGFGAHAEFICLPEDGALAPKPVNVTFAEAAAICEGGLTALPFLRDKGKIQRGHHVLIYGASGAVGASAVQLAKAFGADVTAVCGPSGVELVRSLGADTVIDYSKKDFTQTGQTYDIVFDTTGKSTFSRSRRSLKPDGIYLTTVLTPAIYPQMFWTAKVGGQRAIIDFSNFRPAGEITADLLALKELTEAGMLKPVVDGSYPLAQIAEAHRRVETGHKKGSVVTMLGVE
jgi:NADPH:quinone reductase-like Zn-dependent oxidoreductase